MIRYLSGNRKNIARNFTKSEALSSYSHSIHRQYHSYPDPNEVPKVSQTKATLTNFTNKSRDSFQLNPKFRLDVEFPGVPSSSGININSYPKTHITKLANGITVASQDLPSLMSSIAVIVGSGSADENQTISATDSTFGAVHALELTAFRGTKTRSYEEVRKGIEKLGGVAQCITSRESILYCVDVLRENCAEAVDIFADCVLNPVCTKDDIDECQKVMSIQQTMFPGEMLSKDSVQLAGYKGSPLGNQHYCPSDVIEHVNVDIIERFRQNHIVGENVIISGSGVEHESFVKLIESKFSQLPSIGVDSFQNLKAQRKPSKYTGGMHLNERELKDPLIKIAIGFEIGGWKDELFVPACVLQQLLGGGSSFSAGGPGKGMYTRLYTQVLNKYYWVEAIEAFMMMHNESGIFGIDGTCASEDAQKAINLIMNHLVALAFESVSDEELSRAKNMLRSMMMMQLESRIVVCEDIGRQLATYGHRELPADVAKRIEKVTKEDLQKVARKMLRSSPSVGCVGQDLSYLPSYDRIKEALEPLKKQLKD